MVRRALLTTACLALAGCDQVGGAIGTGQAVPVVAPPRLSPVQLLPPQVNPQGTNRVVLKNPQALPATQVDLFKQGDGVVDILWVIDDEGSMITERQRLGANFQNFMQELISTGSSFQIGVTDTDPLDTGTLRGTTPIITNQTQDPVSVFIANTTFPNGRIRWTEGLRMAQLALTSPNTDPGGANAGFIRPNAALGVIVLSKSDDESYGDPDYYGRFFRGIKGAGNENLVTFSTIAGTTPDGCYAPGEQVFYGGLAVPAFRYQSVSQQTGGVIASICQANFETTLVQIADAINTLRRVFPLSLKADPTTISVTVNGQSIPQDVVNGWQYNASTNSVSFSGNFVPPPGSQIQIQYAIAS
jgi:hypothetical protein